MKIVTDENGNYYQVIDDSMIQRVNKLADMSVLVDSGIDCLFFDDDHKGQNPGYYKLISINGPAETDYIYCDGLTNWKHCKPRLYYWFSKYNFKNSSRVILNILDAGFAVEISFDGGSFKITGLKDGHCWPWESEQ